MLMFSILIAAFASFASGAVYYMTLAKPWMAAAQLKDEDVQNGGPMPFVIAGIVQIIVAAMMAKYFQAIGVTTFGAGMINGAMIGLFFISPWIFLNTAYSKRPYKLALIDSGYAVIATAIIGLVLGLFF